MKRIILGTLVCSTTAALITYFISDSSNPLRSAIFMWVWMLIITPIALYIGRRDEKKKRGNKA